jgi:hypothetical protein
MGDGKGIEISLERLKGRDHLGDKGVDASIILKRILEKYEIGCEVDSSG